MQNTIVKITFTLLILWGCIFCIHGQSIQPGTNGIVYVIEGGAGAKNGSSWRNAYPNLADPLYKARSNTAIKQIWVAKGTYYPVYVAGTTGGDRDKAFKLAKDVKLYGGFAGVDSETSISQRNSVLNPTILSGDLGTKNSNADNCYHVMVSHNNVGTACVDGFIISEGNANGSTLPTVEGYNTSTGDGGGIYIYNSSPTFNNCIFSGNVARVYGGGLFVNAGQPTLTNVLIAGNKGASGAGITDWGGSSSKLTNVTIAGNNGAGLNGNSTILNNSIVWGNSTELIGTVRAQYSLVKGQTPSGTGNLNGTNADNDPKFVAPVSSTSAPTTEGDYRLGGCSPNMGAGNNALYLSARGVAAFSGEKDLAMVPRLYDANIDMGAYERQFIDVAPTITTTSVADGMVGQAYSETLTATSDYTNVTWTIVSGNIPSGINLNASTGVLSGIPTSRGVFTFAVEVSSCAGRSLRQTLSMTIGYTVTFAAGTQGSGTMTQVAIPNGRDYTTPDNEFAGNTGYEFSGWHDGVSTHAVGTTLVAFEGNLTLTAQWVLKSFTLSYDPTGGSPTPASKRVSYGTAIGDLPVVTRTLYDFDDWYTAEEGGIRYEPTTPYTFEVDTTLFAHWKRSSFKLQFVPNGGDVTPPDQIVQLGDAIGSLPSNNLNGYKFNGWFSDYVGGTKYEPTVVLFPAVEVLTLIAQWTRVRTVTFDAQGGSPMPAQQIVNDGTPAELPPITPTPSNGTDIFGGWFDGSNQLWDFNTPVVTDILLTARWINSFATTDTITFNANGGGPTPAQQIVIRGEKVSLPYEPTLTSKFFGGWRIDNGGTDLWDFNAPVEKSLKLIACWLDADYKTVTFAFPSDGAPYAATPLPIPQKIQPNTPATEPLPPIREGHNFDGWSPNNSGSNIWNFATNVSTDITLSAQWTRQRDTVKFDSDGGSPSFSDTVLLYGETLSVPTPQPTRQYRTFDSWHDDSGNPWVFSTPVTRNMTLKAKWNIIPMTVSFNVSSGTPAPPQQTVAQGDTAHTPITPTRTGFIFGGWRLANGGTLWDFNTPVLSSMTLTARWIPNMLPTNTITFDANGGAPSPAQQVIIEGEKVTLPYEPTLTGFVFIGWRKNTDLWDFNAPVTSNFQLDAYWIAAGTQIDTISFDANGGAPAPTRQIVANASTATLPFEPARECYTFGAWYDDAPTFSSSYDFSVPVTATGTHTTLTAKWDPIFYTVSFKNYDGTDIYPDTTVFCGDSLATKPDPTRQYRTFAGWYDQSNKLWNYNTQTFNTPVKSNTVLTAKWDIIPIVVSYNVNGGGPSIPQQTVAQGDTIPRVTPPTRPSYDFFGWYDRGHTNNLWDFNTPLWDYSTPVITTIILSARWEPAGTQFCNVIFDADGGGPTPANQKVKLGETVALPYSPKLATKIFGGWEVAPNELWDFNTPLWDTHPVVSGTPPTLTLKAKWITNPDTVTFELPNDGGPYMSGAGPVPAPQLIEHASSSDTVTMPYAPTREGHIFKGWYDTPTFTGQYNFGTPVTRNDTLFGKWERITYNVKFRSPLSSPAISKDTVISYGDTILQPADPDRTGYTFTGWSHSGSLFWDFGTLVKDSVTLTATWGMSFVTVTFNANGGSPNPATQKIQQSVDTATRPSNPVFVGHNFDYWYHSDPTTPYNFTTLVSSNITLTAHWSWMRYDVNFIGDSVENITGKQLTQSIRHDSVAIRPPDPTRQYYHFVNWYDDNTIFNFTTPVTRNITLAAKWEHNISTVTFNTNGESSPPAPQTMNQGFDTVVRPPDPTKTGKIFRYWYKEDGSTYSYYKNDTINCAYNFGTKVTDLNMRLIAQWNWVRYDVDFVGDSVNIGASLGNQPSQSIRHDSIATQPPDPTRQYFHLLGWNDYDNGGAAYNFSTSVLRDYTLTANWAHNISTVTFSTNGEVTPPPAQQTMNQGFDTVVRPPDPVKTGKIFRYWYKDTITTPYDYYKNDTTNCAYNFGSQVTDTAMTLTAQWNWVRYNVHFVGDNIALSPQSVRHDSTIIEPTTPTHAHWYYVFDGWYDSSTPWNFTWWVDRDIALSAHWKLTVNLYNVHFDTDGASSTPPPQIVVEDSLIVVPPNPTKGTDKFLGWFNGSNYWDFNQPVKTDITLTAHWTDASTPTDTVTFDADGGSPNPNPAQRVVIRGYTVSKPPIDPSRGTSYIFGGWFHGNEHWDFNDTTSGNITLTARWIPASRNAYTVSFAVPQGSPIPASQMVERDSTATLPFSPTRSGYTFAGWRRGSTLWDFNTPVRGNFTLTAYWIPIGTTIYTVNFDANGGLPTPASQLIAADTYCSEPYEPTNPGHVFGGWRNGKDHWEFIRPITSNITLTAKWIPTSTPYCTIDFWASPGSPKPANQIVEIDSTATLPNEPARTNYTFVGWTYKNALTNKDVLWDFNAPVTVTVIAPVTAPPYTMRLTASWIPNTTTTYTVSFNADGGSPTPTQQIIGQGGTVVLPHEPSRAGYVFIGWYNKNNTWDFSSQVTAPLTLTARWVSTTDIIDTVTFNANGGNPTPLQQFVVRGDKVSLPNTPAIACQAFMGWYENAQGWDFNAPTSGNLTLKARWANAGTTTTQMLVFDVNGGKPAPFQQIVERDSTATEPVTPTRAGYLFDGWYNDRNLYVFNAPVKRDILLTAKWSLLSRDSSIIIFDANGGSPTPALQIAKNGVDTVVRPNTPPTRTSYTSDYWYHEDMTTPYDFSSPVTAPITLTAHWKKDTCIVTFIGNGINIPQQSIPSDSTLTSPPTSTRVGYTLIGWFHDDTPWDFQTPVTNDLTLSARWVNAAIPTFTVSFYTGDASPPASQKIERGGKVSHPQEPMRTGYIFGGWLNGATLWNFNTPITANLTLNAKWIANTLSTCTVTFDAAFGTPTPDRQVLLLNNIVEEPLVAPTRPNFTFGGWYYIKNGKLERWFFTNPVTSNLTLTARWIAACTPIFIVTFDATSGSPVPERQIAPRGSMLTLPIEPTRTRFTFGGWTYYNGTENILWDFNTTVTESFTLRARWIIDTILVLTVTFDTKGGNPIPLQQAVAKGQTATTPIAPTLAGHTFSGWLNGNTLWDFNLPVMNALTLTAQWLDIAATTHTVTFDALSGKPIPVTQIVKNGDLASLPAEPMRANYIFGGWTYNNTGYITVWDFNTPVTSNITLSARWIDANTVSHVVTFYADKGIPEPAQQVVAHNSVASTPYQPARIGYFFDGWYSDSVAYDFTKPVTRDLFLTARWTFVSAPPSIPVKTDTSYTVVFIGDYVNEPNQIVRHGDTVAIPALPDPRAGYTFAGWYYNNGSSKLWDFHTPVTSGLTLAAQWVNNTLTTYTVNFNVNGGTPLPMSQTVARGYTASTPYEPVLMGSRFMGWHHAIDSSLWDFNTPITSHLSLYASWRDSTTLTHTVTFLCAPGVSTPSQQVVVDSNLATLPYEPSRPNYIFAGWRLGNDLYFFYTPVTSDITLVARWIHVNTPAYIVNFTSSPGRPTPTQQLVAKGNTVTIPIQPSRLGYYFGDWQYNNKGLVAFWDFNTPVTENLRLVTEWTPIVYDITYDTQGGIDDLAKNPRTYTVSTPTITLKRPTKTGYTFKGWQPANTIPFGSSGDKTFTALWEEGPSNDATLFDLIVVSSRGDTFALTPTFDMYQLEYSLILPCNVDTCILIASHDPDGRVVYGPQGEVLNEPTGGVLAFSGAGRRYVNATSIAANGKDERTYRVGISRLYDKSTVRPYWDDVLAINLNDETNGGYTFKSYTWRKNGRLMGIKTPYLYFSDARPLSPGDYFNVELTDYNGLTLPLCENVTIQDRRFKDSQEISVYPNPVAKGKQIIVNGIPNEVKNIEIYDINGNLLYTSPILETRLTLPPSTPQQTSIQLPNRGGMYIVKIGNQTVKILVE